MPWLNRYPQAASTGTCRMFARPLHQLLDDAVAQFHATPCTNFLGKTLTYREIGHMVDRAAAGLQKLGVKKGTKVGLFLPNWPTFIVYYFAVAQSRRHGRQLQPPLHARGADLPGQGQRDRADGHARPRSCCSTRSRR